jgi:hypothetical protein
VAFRWALNRSGESGALAPREGTGV